jgi:hypothetical protein
MRPLKVAIGVGLGVALLATSASWQAEAAGQKKATVNKAKKSRSELQTEVRFGDGVVHGRYQTPDDATARVESEKLLGNLLSARKHFKDRLLESSEQE